MNKNNRSSRAAAGVKKLPQTITDSGVPSFEQFAEASLAQVEHRTTFDFLHLIKPKWTGEQLAQFGSLVKRWADAVPLPWVPVVHPDLGVVRAYPVPWMQFVYSSLAKKHPNDFPMVPIALENGTREEREELRKLDGTRKQVETTGETVASPELKEAYEKVAQHLASEANRLRAIEGETMGPPTPPPLRAL